MSVVTIDNRLVHYQSLGKGRPVLFLHGWMGSWRYWYPTMERVAKQHRTFSFDFWGFGDSRGRHTVPGIENYVAQVIRFMDVMGIEKVRLVGHSMGGMVAMKAAIEHPDRVLRAVTVGAPIEGSSLSWLLKMVDSPLIARAFQRTPHLRRMLFRHFLGNTEDPAVEEILDASIKADSTTLQRTITSMWHTDLRPDLSRLRVPALVVHGGRDDVVNPNQVNLFAQVAMAKTIVMAECRHFPFFDEPERFDTLLLQFLHDENQRQKLAPQSLRQAIPASR